MNFFKKILSLDKKEYNDNYSDFLDLEKYEKEIELSSIQTNKKYLKIFIFSDPSQMKQLKEEIQKGNILFIDISKITNDHQLKKDFLIGLKKIIEDINGDIVGVKENIVLTTPQGISIDRNKIGEIN